MGIEQVIDLPGTRGGPNTASRRSLESKLRVGFRDASHLPQDHAGRQRQTDFGHSHNGLQGERHPRQRRVSRYWQRQAPHTRYIARAPSKQRRGLHI